MRIHMVEIMDADGWIISTLRGRKASNFYRRYGKVGMFQTVQTDNGLRFSGTYNGGRVYLYFMEV